LLFDARYRFVGFFFAAASNIDGRILLIEYLDKFLAYSSITPRDDMNFSWDKVNAEFKSMVRRYLPA
jgi:hypothetical protein